MKDQKEIKWLYKELPALIDKGVLSEESATKIRSHYGQPSKTASYNTIFIISAILGSLLIGLGVILVFAYNWDNLSRGARTVLSFVPLLIAQAFYGYAFFKKKDSIPWIEATSGFLMLMLGSTLALIGQTYNTDSTLGEYLFTWMLLSIPLIYIRNATIPLVLFLIGITWRYFLSEHHFLWRHTDLGQMLEFWLFFLAVIPSMIVNIKSADYTVRANIIGWFSSACIFISSYRVFIFQDGLPLLFYQACIFTMLYVIGKYLCDHEERIIKKPFQVIGISGIYLLMITCTYDSFWRNYKNEFWHWDRGIHRDHLLFYILAFIALGLIITGVARKVMKKEHINFIPVLFPALIGLGCLLTKNDNEYIAAALCDAYLFVYGVFYIVSGVQLERFSLVNTGMFFVCSLICIRFVSSDVDFIVKGVVFILLGVGFLGVNYWLAQRLKKEEDHE
ncbi:MAG TPA: DUF2157 domain-containing protein [Bacteroidia bacterium]